MSLKQKTINGVFWSSVERFSTQGVGFLIGLFLARILSPQDYGTIAMLTVFISLSGIFIDSGFTSALIRKKDRDIKDTSTIFYFNTLIGVLCYLILFFCAPLIADFYNIETLKPLVRIVAITVIFNSSCVIQQTIMVINLNFKLLAKISMACIIVSGIVGIVMALNGYGVWALAFQQLSSSVLRFVLMWIFARWRPQKIFCKESFKALFPYGSRYFVSGVIEVVYNNIYSIIIGKVYSPASLGTYNRAEQLANFPSTNITGIIQKVTYPVLSSLQDDDHRLRESYIKLLRFSSFIIFPLMLGLAAVADPLIRLILTDKWSDSIILLQIICFALMWFPVHALNVNVLEVKGCYKLFLRPQIVKKLFGVVILVIAIPYGIKAIAISTVITSVFALGINLYYTKKIISINMLTQLKFITPFFINSLIMAGLSYVMTLLFTDNIVRLIMAILTGGTYFLVSSYLLKFEELSEVRNVALQLKTKLRI